MTILFQILQKYIRIDLGASISTVDWYGASNTWKWELSVSGEANTGAGGETGAEHGRPQGPASETNSEYLTNVGKREVHIQIQKDVKISPILDLCIDNVRQF